MLPLDRHRRLRARSSWQSAGLVLLLAVSLLGAGCSSEQAGSQASSPPSSTRPTATQPASPAAPKLSKYSKAELARRPCLALDAHDLAALGITGEGKEEAGENGPACRWKVADQSVSLHPNVSLSYARTMTKNGQVSQVPVGLHKAVQAEFQHICFIFVAVDEPDELLSTTTIPERGGSQGRTCPAGASVAAAALTHIE